MTAPVACVVYSFPIHPHSDSSMAAGLYETSKCTASLPEPCGLGAVDIVPQFYTNRRLPKLDVVSIEVSAAPTVCPSERLFLFSGKEGAFNNGNQPDQPIQSYVLPVMDHHGTNLLQGAETLPGRSWCLYKGEPPHKEGWIGLLSVIVKRHPKRRFV